ncbi:MAG TPA: Gfo/Idh/MocA family oxidoreductase [Methylococcales bacterium]
MKKLKIGIVGLSFGCKFLSIACGKPLQISRRRQLKRLLRLEHHVVSAPQNISSIERLVVCDLEKDRVDSARRKNDIIAAGYTSIEQMLEAETLDGILLFTPDQLHQTHAELCFAAGCHVLLTKPMACNLADARAIVHAAENSSRKLMIAQERRFRPRILALKKILDAEDLGDVIHLRSDITQDKQAWMRQRPWFFEGRSPMTGTGIHEVDLIRHLIGSEIESVAAFANRLGDLRLGNLEFPKDKTTAALFQFRNGAIGQVTATYVARPKKGRIKAGEFVITATKGAVVDSRVARNGNDEWEDLPWDFNDNDDAGVQGCLEAFLNMLLFGTEPPVTGRDAFASLAACVAADESSATGRVVKPESCD